MTRFTILILICFLSFSSKAYWLSRSEEAVYYFSQNVILDAHYIQKHSIKQIDIFKGDSKEAYVSHQFDKRGFLVHSVNYSSGGETWNDYHKGFFRQIRQQWNRFSKEGEKEAYYEDEQPKWNSKIKLNRNKAGFLSSIEYISNETSQTILYEYNDRNQLVKYIDPRLSSSRIEDPTYTFEYDQSGNIIKQTEPDRHGKSILDLSWDNENRLIQAVRTNSWQKNPDSLFINYKEDSIFMKSVPGSVEAFYEDYIYVVDEFERIIYLSVNQNTYRYSYKYY